jgi:hypothetical protein
MKYVKHWALFVESFHLLLGTAISQEQVTRADLLLTEFVLRTQVLYGQSAMTFNVHQLLHVSECVRICGPLWATSAYPFETTNGKLLRIIKNANGIPHQICRNICFQLSADLIVKLTNVNANIRVQSFLKKLKNEVSDTCKKDNIRYFSSVLNADKNNWVRSLEIQEPQFFKKIVVNGCMYTSYASNKSDNSYVKLCDNTFGQVQVFLLDSNKNMSYCIVRKVIVDCNNYSPCDNFIHKYKKINNIDEAVLTSDIVAPCVNIIISNSEKYIVPFPNLYHY